MENNLKYIKKFPKNKKRLIIIQVILIIKKILIKL